MCKQYHIVFYNLPSEVTENHFIHILLKQLQWLAQVREINFISQWEECWSYCEEDMWSVCPSLSTQPSLENTVCNALKTFMHNRMAH